VLRLRFAAFSDEKLVERFRVVAHELGEAVTTCMPAVGLTNRLFAIRALSERCESERGIPLSAEL
jgi:hypothetical protein